MRLIDADTLLKALDGVEVEWYVDDHGVIGDTYDTSTVVDIIASQPTIEAEPVMHGRWVDNGIPESMLSKCSVCDYSCGAYSFNYCPNCGAKMDGGAENE